MAKTTQADKDFEVVTSINVIMFRSLDMYVKQSQRIISEIQRKIALYVMEQVKNLESNAQNVVLEKFFHYKLAPSMYMCFYNTLIMCSRLGVNEVLIQSWI
jgi:hypothetical protein